MTHWAWRLDTVQGFGEGVSTNKLGLNTVWKRQAANAVNNAKGCAYALVKGKGVRGEGNVDVGAEVAEGVEDLDGGVKTCPLTLSELFPTLFGG